MQHPRSFEVLHELETTRHLVRNVEAVDGFPDQIEVGRRLQRCILIELEGQNSAPDQATEPQLPAVFTDDHTVADRERRCRGLEFHCSSLEQCAPRGRSGSTQLRAAILDGQAPETWTLIRSEQRVALNESYVPERHIELLSDDLRERGVQPRAEIDLARVNRDPPVCADREIAIDQVRCDGLRRAGSAREREARRETERHHQQPRRFEH